MTMVQINEKTLAKLREICLAYPEAVEDNAGVGSPGFKVRKKIFAMHHGRSGKSSLWCKAPAGVQQILVASASQQFFVPPYVGHNGWVGIWLDRKTDWEQLAELVEESYCMTAPKRLVAQIKPKE